MTSIRKFRPGVLLFTLVITAACAEATAAPPEMTVYATPTCGCCGAWIEHMRESGFTVQVVYQDDLSAIRREHRVPAEVTSCHMGVVGGFVVEGHVPAAVVNRLLTERPAVLGVAVPGMPVGSPGMEHPSGVVQPYDIYTFDAQGPTAVYEHRN